ncbi:Hypothetical predicted protein [Olea europaea subsp. europaea]|uniref:Uncharacterized protein n=1 Tax=Olea europaea subsp. europaea TaxID=158383 RepID=A0A8S0QSW1_OLEEU|nr:Hypothetical predicted protein [Olea europaea subsp. europaea]
MNRSFRESAIGDSRNFPLAPLSQHRRGLSLNGLSNFKNSANNNLDLFSKNRHSLPLAASDNSDASVKLGRLSVGSAKQGKSGLDDLLSSTDGGGKHDYDWLLTPPGTPIVPSMDGNESQQASVAPRGSSRFSVSQSESNHPKRPTRSSSVTRPSVTSSHFTMNSNKSTSILNTSSASVSSYIRPSTPTSRNSSITRPSTPTARSTASRPSTPSKPRASPSTSSSDKPRPSISSRPSTPTSRPQVPANLNSPAARSTSRPSTPTRRSPAPSISPASGPLASIGRAIPNGRNVASVSRPSSPIPRVRAPPQPIVLPDFSLETPPNLLTTLPDRPLSAGRSRPGLGLTVKGDVESTSASTSLRRQQSPVVTRGRHTEPIGRCRMPANGQLSDAIDTRRELSTRKPLKTSTESTGFGRNISKKSLDMAIRHMDIRNGTNGVRPLTGSTLFPQSIRSTNKKSSSNHLLSATASVNGRLAVKNNSAIAENGYHINRSSDSGSEEDKSQSSAKLTNIDVYESSRYDMILLREDLKSTNWLCSLDNKSEQEPIFDNGFEPLPEPFGPL